MANGLRIFILFWYIATLVMLGMLASGEERVEAYPDNQVILDMKGALK